MKAYLTLGKQYKKIVTIPKWSLWSREREAIVNSYGLPVIENCLGFELEEDFEKLKTRAKEMFKSITPGLNYLFIHPVIDYPEVKEIIPSWKHRYNEYKLMMDDDIKECIQQNEIELVTWTKVAKMCKAE